jgi:hypothetical protein
VKKKKTAIFILTAVRTSNPTNVKKFLGKKSGDFFTPSFPIRRQTTFIFEE